MYVPGISLVWKVPHNEQPSDQRTGMNVCSPISDITGNLFSPACDVATTLIVMLETGAIVKFTAQSGSMGPMLTFPMIPVLINGTCSNEGPKTDPPGAKATPANILVGVVNV